MSLANKTVKNSAYSVFAFAWPMALSFFATPFIVSKLGQEYYGIYALVLSFVGFFGVLDFGVAPALVKYVAELKTKKEYSKLSKIFSSAIFFYLAVGVIGAVLIILLSPYFINSVIKNSTINPSFIWGIFVISSFGFIITMLLSAYSAIPGALQRFDLTSKINVVISTLSTIGIVSLLFAGFGLKAVVVFNIVTSLIGLIIYIILDKKMLPKIKLTFKIDRGSFKTIMGFGGVAFIASISSMIISNLDRLILGGMLGPTDVTYYVIPGNLTIKILGFVNAITTVIFPLSASLLAAGETESLKKLYKRATRLIGLLLVLIIVPAFVMSGKFLLYWLGPDFAKNSTFVLQVLLLTYGFSALASIPYLISFGSGRPKYSAFYAASVAAINVLFMFLLIPKFGINGASIAYLAAVVPTTLVFVRFVEVKIVKTNKDVFWLPQILKLFAVAVVTTILSVAANYLVSNLLLFMTAYVIIIFVSSLFILKFKLADKEDIELFKNMLLSFRNNKVIPYTNKLKFWK